MTTSSRTKTTAGTTQKTSQSPPIWWSNAILFCSIHLLALTAVLYRPSTWRPYFLCYINWQLATLGITVGYHRLWSHRSFTARAPLRLVLAIMGTMGFQGSIKWWVIRHRLHHRYTDTDSDPYSAEKGLFHSHMGWIFVKPHYPKVKLIDQTDLNADPIVIFQHKFFVPLSLSFGFALPALVGKLWFDDAWMGLLWGGLLARVAIWHCTFLINSLAHYIGDQFYSTDVSARGNFILAMLTNGEGFHNYHHAFPCDYRNGIAPLDWDPTKWIVYALHRYTTLIPSIRKISARDIDRARARVALAHSPLSGFAGPVEVKKDLPQMTREEIQRKYQDKAVVIIEGYLVEVGSYAEEHPGGEGLFRAHYGGGDATKGFQKLNHHTAHARGLVEDLRIAQVM